MATKPPTSYNPRSTSLDQEVLPPEMTNWSAVEPPEKSESVSWDDEIPNGKILAGAERREWEWDYH